MKLLELTCPPEPARLDAAALHAVLCAEFRALNAAHFEGRLRCPEIIISRRKTYGGYYQPQRNRIVISWQAYLEHGMPETLNTFRHEVAHILHPNHKAEFWTLAAQLGVTRRHALAPLTQSQRRYIYSCPACGSRIERRRRLRLASCARCDSAFNPLYKLRLISEEVSAPVSVGTH